MRAALPLPAWSGCIFCGTVTLYTILLPLTGLLGVVYAPLYRLDVPLPPLDGNRSFLSHHLPFSTISTCTGCLPAMQDYHSLCLCGSAVPAATCVLLPACSAATCLQVFCHLLPLDCTCACVHIRLLEQVDTWVIDTIGFSGLDSAT